MDKNSDSRAMGRQGKKLAAFVIKTTTLPQIVRGTGEALYPGPEILSHPHKKYKNYWSLK